MDCLEGEPRRNTEKMLEFVANAAALSADIVVFPEMSDTGYDMPKIVRTASSWDEGPVVALRRAAKESGLNIIAGVSERAESDVYNAVVVIDRQGEIVVRYRKTHLITAAPIFEHEFLRAGDSLCTAQLEGTIIGLMTCYDLRFPEMARALALQGAKVIFVPAAWPLVRLPHWTCLTAARAIENQVFLIAIGRIGSDGGPAFSGTSTIYNPYGVILASASQIHERIIIADVDLNEVDLVRKQIQVHQDRRPELYQVT